MNTPHWAHHSFTPPFTRSGRAALVPTPPWRYAGWLGGPDGGGAVDA